MGYIQQSLGKNEKVLYHTKFHWIFWLMGWLSLAAFLGLAGLFIFGQFNDTSVGKQTLIIPAVIHKNPFHHNNFTP